ncbi:transcriptional regulator [Brevundimonas sp.]|uniref:transcriptional regulator n=1 Tax=Brevundimonas sp. TaxID=1871086 RepID=UPI00391C0D11
MIDNSYLLGLFGQSTTWGGGTTTTARKAKAQPTPPWDSTREIPQSDLLRSALAGRSLFNDQAARLDLPGASADYGKLFSLYQGLASLAAMADRAGTKGVASTELSLLNKRFETGLSEVSNWLSQAGFDAFNMVQGTSSSLSKSTAAVTRDTSKSLTGVIHEGAVSDPVAAFQGDVRFRITVGKLEQTVHVDIDLTEMGAQTRSLTNVLGFINGKLEDAGVQARIGREMIPAEERSIKVGDKTVALPNGPDRWALLVRGSSVETLQFSAPDTADAVYVTQGTGSGNQLLKFTDGGVPSGAGIGETHWVDGRLAQDGLPEGISAIRASATDADGNVWMVADLSEGLGNQPIKGTSDVALMKFDSAGRLVFSRALGAADQASGYALAISDDGRVAVAGSVTGALDNGAAGANRGLSDSFVTVFNLKGEEQWTQRRGATAADEATAVTFGADGAVYVAGRAQSAMVGASAQGGWDGYLQGFSQHQAYPTAPITGGLQFTTQFGTAGEDSVASIAVDGNNLYTAGVENGRAVVRHYELNGAGQPTLLGMRDLGAMSGEIAGIAVSDGRVIVAGTTRNENLAAGATVTTGYSGGTDAFVLSMDGDLGAGGDRLSFHGGAGDDTVADVKVHDGKVWITGVADRPLGGLADDPTMAYLSRIDPDSGAVEWTRTWKGAGDQAVTGTIAVASGGASILDRLGLPTGVIAQGDSKQLTAATSLRVGDRFYVVDSNGRSRAVTIEARDTLQTLARKIEQASNMQLKVTIASEGGEVSGKDGETTLTMGGFQRLSIQARDGREGAVLRAGESGRDALAGLGLSPGFVGKTSGADTKKTYGVQLPGNLNLSGVDAAKRAGEAILAAMSVVRDAYRGLAPANNTAKPIGQPSAYMSAQIANYQAALDRLMGG